MRHLAGNSERLQVLHSVTVRHGVGNVGESLGRLPDWNRGDDFIGQRIYGSKSITILKSDIHTRSIAGRPNPMGQFADRNCRYLSKLSVRKTLISFSAPIVT